MPSDDLLIDETVQQPTELLRLDEAFPEGGRHEKRGVWRRFRDWISHRFRFRRSGVASVRDKQGVNPDGGSRPGVRQVGGVGTTATAAVAGRGLVHF